MESELEALHLDNYPIIISSIDNDISGMISDCLAIDHDGLVNMLVIIKRVLSTGLITVTHALFTLTREQYEETLTSLSEVLNLNDF